MPKKTRREKIITKLRRELMTQKTNPATADLQLQKLPKTESQPVNSNRINYQPKPNYLNQVSTSSYTIDHSHVVRDLKKIFTITVMAVIFESLLYFLINMNGLNSLGMIFKK